MDEMLTASVEAVLADGCTPAFVRRVEQARERGTGRELWRKLDELGFLDALVAEAHGGAGLSLVDAAGVLVAFGRHALPLPAAQTIVARPLAAAAGIEAPRGPIAIALADSAQAGSAFVPYGQVADALLVQTRDGTRLIGADETTLDAHGDGLDAVARFAPNAGHALDLPAGHVAALGALATAATMAGAMQRVLEMTLVHVNDRQQFGRPIGKFQAVQQQLSVMAEHVAATHMAVQIGCAAHGGREQTLGSAIAKARASRAAPLVAGTAHGLAGAMGITAEYDLQLYTRRLHAQRLHYGSESSWDEVVGAHAIENWNSAAAGIIDLFGTLDEAARVA